MNKPVFGLTLGAILGMIDGASAYLYPYPDVRAQILMIVIGSTFKGLVTGLVAGLVARKRQSLPLGIGVGLVVGFALSLLAVQPWTDQPHYYLEILLPGMAVGAICGFATQRYRRVPQHSS